MQLLGHHNTQKQDRKRDAVRLTSSSNFKVDLILLTKAKVVQVIIFNIEVGELGLQQLFSKLCLDWSRRRSLVLVF